MMRDQAPQIFFPRTASGFIRLLLRYFCIVAIYFWSSITAVYCEAANLSDCCFLFDTDDPDLWNQTLEAEEIQSAIEKAEKKESHVVHQAQNGSMTHGGKKRRIDATVRI